MQHRYFITASGTEVGKTFITTALCHQFQQQGLKVRPLKPVVTGWGNHTLGESDNDTQSLLKASGLPIVWDEIQTTSPWRFSAPLSPHMAAARQMTELSAAAIADHCLGIGKGKADAVFVEGVGGVMVPLNHKETTLDLIQMIGYPAILVVGSYLGAISHGLTAYRALKSTGVPIALVVVNESSNSPVDFLETARSFAMLMPEPMISIPRMPFPQNWKDVSAALSRRLLKPKESQDQTS